MVYHFKIHREPNSFWAECLELKGCVTQAGSLEELQLNMEEALNLYLDEPASSNITFPMPQENPKGKNIVEVAADPRIAFALTMRILRMQRGLTQSEAAHLLGMKNIYSYQRLERGKNANPCLTTLARIKKIFPEFKLDEIVKEKKERC
jgi:antitoxin HicB